MPHTIVPTPEKSSAAWDDQLLADPHAVADKRRRVREMFAAIAPSYDLNNRLHSLGVDQRWRRRAVKLSQLKATDRVVDVACGTGDLIEAFRDAGDFTGTDFWPEGAGWRYLGVDFTFEMLPIARRKSSFNDLVSTIEYVNGDAQALPLPDASADIVSIAFGIRNVQDPAVAFAEFRRVAAARRSGHRARVLPADQSDAAGAVQRLLPPRAAADGHAGQRGQDRGLQVPAREREHVHPAGPKWWR